MADINRPRIQLSNDSLTNIQQRSRVANKHKILEAAGEEFKLHGYNGASIVRIAALAKIPRTNIHYYFKNKLALYGAVLTNIIDLWNQAFADIQPDDDPAQAISSYIDAKLEYSRTNPTASIIFASEILYGAPYLSEYLQTDFKKWIGAKAHVIEAWQAQGKIDNVSPYHLLFTIWGATQHYANFAVEIEAALGHPLNEKDFDDAKKTIKHIVLKGCGMPVNGLV
ncbi:TetR/AcrR family transcriptional regulator [Glaciecola punicea ACAM 611]|jgi:TetR/AcrR family transcriptional regulator|uniref:TetR/AcrR family transcriptional regulator n=1 Tax=Glaciecola punicea ACAM 611 TaxID=1121923 RepID=H5T894_9ALTE|nr:TetR family transcriptional regulator C-terminal domain-containing protein [Glaciecola punicea]OFA29913.1 TetR family transcriptional regulator [Glaciecola punicea]GAB54535.1 TetR/AcrR family transcriptional regulator [Glaciecola punicea ACAM 611]